MTKRNDAPGWGLQSASMPRRTPDKTLLEKPIAEALEGLTLTEARELGLGSCFGCVIAPFETLNEASRCLKLDMPRVLAAIDEARRRRPR